MSTATPIPHAKRTAADAEAPQAGFSALDLRDRVVIMLLFDQIVTEEQVSEVWALWKQQHGGSRKEREPFWRMLTLLQEVDRELVFAEAARVYGIEEARIERRAAVPMIEMMARTLPKAVVDEMAGLRLVLVAEGEQNHSHRRRLIFACHDPTHPRVQALMPRLGLDSYEVRYAPELTIVELLAEVFPWKYRALYDALCAERASAAAAAEAAEPPAPAAEPPPEEPAPEADLNSSSIRSFFEELLVQAVRKQVQGICVAPNGSTIEVYFQDEEGLQPWRVADHIHPEAFFSTLRSTTLKGEAPEHGAQAHLIKRWIDGEAKHFRISSLPPGEAFDHDTLLIRLMA